jgi:hypothetical protein
LRISIVNALPVNCHPTVVAVDGRTSFKHDVNGPSETLEHQRLKFVRSCAAPPPQKKMQLQ